MPGRFRSADAELRGIRTPARLVTGCSRHRYHSSIARLAAGSSAEKECVSTQRRSPKNRAASGHAKRHPRKAHSSPLTNSDLQSSHGLTSSAPERSDIPRLVEEILLSFKGFSATSRFLRYLFDGFHVPSEVITQMIFQCRRQSTDPIAIPRVSEVEERIHVWMRRISVAPRRRKIFKVGRDETVLILILSVNKAKCRQVGHSAAWGPTSRVRRTMRRRPL